MTNRFKSQNVVATGAGCGIGRASALVCAREGATVLAVDLDESVETLAHDTPAITAHRADVCSTDDLRTMVETALALDGGIDVFIVNAGVSGGTATIFKQSAQDWADILIINLIGPFLAIQQTVRHMLGASTAGRIVCTASVVGLRAGAGGPPIRHPRPVCSIWSRSRRTSSQEREPG